MDCVSVRTRQSEAPDPPHTDKGRLAGQIITTSVRCCWPCCCPRNLFFPPLMYNLEDTFTARRVMFFDWLFLQFWGQIFETLMLLLLLLFYNYWVKYLHTFCGLIMKTTPLPPPPKKKKKKAIQNQSGPIPLKLLLLLGL